MKKIFISLILLLFLVPAGNPVYSQEQFKNLNANQKMYLKANNYYENKQYLKAINILENFIKSGIDFYELRILLGLNYLSIQNYDQAQKNFSNALKLEPDNWEPYIGLANVFYLKNLHAVAIMTYDKALSMKNMPKDMKNYYKKIREEVIEDQKNINIQNPDTNNHNQNFVLNIDAKQWYKAYDQGDDEAWIVEYGQVGESVVDYIWTKLISVSFFNGEVYTKLTPELALKTRYESLKEHMDILNAQIKFKTINQPGESIYYTYSIPNFKESEIGRIYKGKKGIYTIRYTAKKKSFTSVEQEEILNILRSFKPTK